jgi:hypothetical protein
MIKLQRKRFPLEFERTLNVSRPVTITLFEATTFCAVNKVTNLPKACISSNRGEKWRKESHKNIAT